MSEAPADLPLTPVWDKIRLTEEHQLASVDTGEIRSWWEARERFLAECMKQQGFEYYPTTWEEKEQSEADGEITSTDHGRLMNQLPIPSLDSSRDTAAQYGYGTQSTLEKLVSKSSTERAESVAYYESLSTERRLAYDLALNGPEAESYDLESLPTQGCVWEAEAKHPEPSSGDEDDLVTTRFGDLVNDLTYFKSEPAMEADQRLVELNTQWRECMTAAGVSTEGLRKGATEPGSIDGPGAAYTLATLTGTDGVVADMTADEPPEREDQRSLTGSEHEIKIALADYDCRAQTGYLERLVEVQREFEEDFVKTHRQVLSELDDYVDQHAK